MSAWQDGKACRSLGRWAGAGLTQMRTPLTLGMVEVENQSAFD